ncbi:MAG: LamG domain-containing protein, partial [Proteobacteria bacterium]|nr:LamG domain-containing protein [Pseudomonadota bacterium]
MGTLIRHSTPAERFCKCSLALGFDSSEDVARASGVISGTPTIAGGLATLNGTTGYITYALTGNEFNSAEISIVIEFWPDFDTDENVARMLFDSTTSNRYLCYKQTNANSNVLTIFLGNILIASIAEATYSPFWLVGQRNVLQISGTSTDTSAWLNGNLILDADATAWTAKTPVTFYIGSEHNTFKRFDGKIGPIKVFKGLLTAQDALNFYNKNTYAYRENYAFHLPMRAQEHDPTNTQTLDIQNSNHGAFGAGAAEPTKNSGRGYYYDGGDYLLIADSVDLRIRTNDFAIGVLFKRTTAGTNKALIAK